ncbi:unnamed protein product [Arabidopsis lyrata]|nr:unnamed protein product [Arabidopsis lyrata]
MWRLRIGAEAGQDPHFFSTNNYLGRQIWEFHAKAGSVEELSKVEEARRNFANNRSSFKASADLLWLTMQAQKEVLNSDMQSNEKFMIQSVIASPAVTAKEVTRETVLIIHIIDLMDNHTLVLVP